ncbi:MAG: Thioredoxin reductase [candidate division TM6 bacterium GW2011_GWF2_38_10]|nr:MAG: Thioredoxin reductase [candidate division TM6 bacterium GW2011_GWF2_38_10]
MIYKVAIIGSGPAGLTAGIYMARGKYSTIVLEGPMPGGQLTTTTAVENWPGSLSIMGQELMENMRAQAQKNGCFMLQESATQVDFSQRPFTITTDGNKTIQAESVIIATGSRHKKLGCPGEDAYWGSGVAVCATCDAPFYQNKTVVVVGGGNSAMVEADHLAHFANKVIILNLLENLTATDPIKDKVLANPKIEIKYSTKLNEIKGDKLGVTHVILENTITHATAELKTDGVFVAIGLIPNSEIFKDSLKTDAYGYLVSHENTKTTIPGVFVAGEIADHKYRQAATSAGQGCMAALDCQAFLNT